MYHSVRVKLQNLLLSLSDALDLASPDLSQHQLRTSFVAWEIGKAAGLSTDDMTDLFIASLLHDVGALTTNEKLEVHLGKVEFPERHCFLGEKLLKQVSRFVNPSKIVRYHHTHYNDKNHDELPPSIALSAQILLLADTLERSIDRHKFILHQEQSLIGYIKSLAGTYIRSDIVELFQSIAVREDFWFDLVSPRLYSTLLNNGPCRTIEVELSQLLTISEMFRDMIDFRSRFTATHSSGVAAAASALSKAFGFTQTEIELMEVAGNLHDLGKMAVPNSILNKPDKLTNEEFAIMRQHTYYTYTILSTIGGIQYIAEWAAFHHERLDGSGYPFHIDGKNLSINSRIMAVADIFTALTEQRPYRKSLLGQEQVLSILKSHCSRNWLDTSIVNLLERNYQGIDAYVRERQASTSEFYEREFQPETFAEIME
ncbi:MAG: HD domain-containing protein [Anaerolineaceae bacterium]|nr:HD domain-containing protein [Anaerolineaceae bacterium]